MYPEATAVKVKTYSGGQNMKINVCGFHYQWEDQIMDGKFLLLDVVHS